MQSDREEPDKGKLKRGVLQIRPGIPLSFDELPDVSDPEVAAGNPRTGGLVGTTIKAYRDAARTLLASKYQDLRPFAPNHLSDNCNITAIQCDDGLIVRYDKSTQEPGKVRSGFVKNTLTEFVPPISEYLIHLPLDATSYDPGPHGPRLELAKFKLDSPEIQEPFSTVRLLVFATHTLPPGTVFPPPPHKPPCLVSMTNEIEIQLGGVIVPADADLSRPAAPTHEFVARSKIKLQLSWQAIEIYPTLNPEYWKPEYAPIWAETDLLAAVARQQFSDAQFAALDPNVTARKTFQRLFEQFMALLDGPEEPLHQFLRKHPQLLCPAHTKFWSKLPLGDRVTDFVFCQPGNDYLLVELESPLKDLFRKDGQQREELTHAFNQILDWRVYIEDHLPSVQHELGLTGVSSNPSSLIVIGRSSSLSDENRRKLTALQNQIPKLRILTYEDLLQSARAVAENLFGPLGFTGENVDIYFIPT